MNKVLFKSFSAITMLALVLMALPMPGAQAAGPVSLTILDTPYTQNFDTLPTSGSATWTNNSTIPGWFHARTGTGTTIVANDGSSNAGNLYSYGTGTTTDRALGSLGSSNAAVGNLFWGVRLANDTGATITSLDISYTGEQWRNSAAAAQTVAFSYLIGSPTVTGTLAEFQSAGTVVPSLDFTSPITGGTAGALNGNLATNRVPITFSITGLSIPAGTEIMLRWSDPDHTGSDHGLAIDDFSVTPHGTVVPPNLTINDVSANEGNSGPTSFDFTVSLSSPAGPGGVTFDIATQDNSATVADNDYAVNTLTGQTIPAGSSTYTFSVLVNGDTTVEPNETFFVNVTNVIGATVGDGQGQGTIQNDDAIVPNLTVNDVSASEGNSGTSNFTFTVNLSAPAGAGGVTFDIATQDNTAMVADNDYVTKTLTGQTIPAGSSTYAFDVVVNGDTTVEPNETFFVNVTNVTNATILDGQGQGTIQNDDAVPPGSVVISQVYGGGGNASAPFKNDFIELYNRTASPVSLSGWSVQYASAAGTSWQVTSLAGSIGPGEYYLVREGAGNSCSGSPCGVDLPAPDALGIIPMAAGSGKVALVNVTAALTGACPTGSSISDFVGYGTSATCSETAPTATLSNTTAALRLGGGAQDSDNNSADFSVGAPNPRSRTPSVISTTPSNGAFGVLLNTNITINFSKPVNVTGSWFTISCANSGSHTATVGGGPTTFTVDPDSDFAYNELCTITILASQVTDQDANDPPDNMAANYVFSFTSVELLQCSDPATPIHDIQGSGAASPLVGMTNVVIQGVVVGDYQNTTTQFSGFHLQEEDADADADPLTSEGIFVFDNGFGVDVQPGDVVRVKGTVSEFFDLTEMGNVTVVQVCGSGSSVTPATVSLPVSNLSDWEAFEGMLINISQDLTVTETFNLGRFGEVSLSANGRLRNPTNIVAPGAPAIAQQDLNNRSVFVMDDGNNQQNIDPTIHPTGGLSAASTLRSGYTVHGLTGVLEQRFGDYRVQPVGPVTFDASTNPRVAAPSPVGGNLKVAALNVLNFFTTLDTAPGLCGPTGGLDCRGANSTFEFNRQRDKMVNAILAIDPDIAGMMEVQNDSGATIQNVVDGLNVVAGPGTYAYINTGTIGTDAIKVAIIYKPATVTPVGAYAILDSSVDPLFIDTKNRPSLAQTFSQNSNGEKLTVVVNHLKSKGSDCNDVGDPDIGDGQGNCNQTRKKAAMALVAWLATDPTGSGDPDFLVVGDMNSYAKEDPITTIEAGGYTNLLETIIGADAYSYVFDGQSGYLDHALASSSLVSQVSGVTEWHNNADEPTVLDYNVEFKTANQVNTFYTSEPYRASDHDPVVVGLNLDTAAPDTTIDSGPSNPSNSSSASFSFSGTDNAGGSGVASFECDLDGGGFSACTSPQNYSSLADGSHIFQVRAIDNAGNVDPTPASFTWTIDATAPSVTIDQASGQADPTGNSPISFTVVFSESVTGFDGSDVTLSGTAGATTAVVTGGPITYDVAVSGMTANGTVIASIPANAAADAVGNNNTASTSTDNTVTFANTAPTIVVAAGGVCSSSGGTMNLTIADVDSNPLTLSGSSSNTSAVPNANIVFGGSGSNRTVSITAIASSTVRTATVTVSVNDGLASTSVNITVVVGTSGNNTMNGTSGADLMLGLAGNDVLSSLAGNDLLCGGSGNNTISGGDNDDTLVGDSGNDVLNGDNGNDILLGAGGNDSLTGGAGNDSLNGDSGNDALNGGAGNDSMSGGIGNDSLTGGANADFFSGGAGSDANTDFNAGQGDTSDGT